MENTGLAKVVTMAAAGDERGWEELVRRFGGMVWSTARSFRLAGPDAEDVSQTVWLLLSGHIRRLREPEALPGWLATTARRESLRVARRRQVESRQLLLEDRERPDSAAPAPDEEVLREELRRQVRRAFEQLSGPCQRLLAMLTVDPPVGYRAIAEALEMPTGSIGPTRARCLEKLRRIAGLPGTNGGGGSPFRGEVT